MTDRLKDLKKGVQLDDVAIDIGISGEGDGLVSKSGAFMQEFFGDVDIIKNNINAIKDATRRISEINQDVAFSPTSDKEIGASEDLSEIIKVTNKKAHDTKAFLKHIQEQNAELKKKSDTKQSELRIRENLANTLTRKFVDVMKDYQNAQSKYKTDIKKKVKRQVQIVKPDATTEEIDAVLKSNKGSGEIFKSAILKGEAADSIRNAYMNVADKYQDILTLEASVAELHQMFMDFALLVEQQGGLLDQIEEQVKMAVDYVDEGNTQLIGAVELQKNIRKWQCCILMLVLVIIGIIVGVVVAYYKQKEASN